MLSVESWEDYETGYRCSLRGAWSGLPPKNQKNKLSVPQFEAECGYWLSMDAASGGDRLSGSRTNFLLHLYKVASLD